MITIIGAGSIGLCTAYFLHKEGCKVQLIERTTKDDISGCSHGNAGMIVPSHFIPLAAPGVIHQGLKWLLDSKSPFYIKPRWNADLLNWMWLFYRSSNHRNIRRVGDQLFQLNQVSRSLYKSIIYEEGLDVGFERKGLMMLFQTAKVEAEEHKLAKKAESIGIQSTILNQKEIQDIETDLEMNVRGGVHYTSDAHLTPGKFMNQLRDHLLREGVEIFYDTQCEDIYTDNRSIKSIKTNRGIFETEKLIIAAGSWTGVLAKKLNKNIPFQGGKGYSLTIKDCPNQLKTPSILCERKIAITPMGRDLRIAGTMEIAGLDRSVSTKRLQGIKQGVTEYLTNFRTEWTEELTPWTGLRPVSPDGVPYIGKCNKWNNLYFNSGHAMMGLSLAPVSGQIVTDIVLKKPVSFNTEILSPNRF